MLRGNDVVGSPVVTAQEDVEIARIRAVIVDLQRCRVLAFLIERGGWLGSARVLPWWQIVEVRPEKVIAQSSESVVDARTTFEIQQVLEQNYPLQGASVIAEDGHRLGRVTDFYFDEQDGEVEGYEVSQSRVGRAAHRFVPAAESLEFCDAVVRVSRSVVDELWAAGKKSVAAVPDEQASNLDHDLIGRRVRWDMRTPEGHLFAAQGQIVTLTVVNRAKSYDRLDDLVRATDLNDGS